MKKPIFFLSIIFILCTTSFSQTGSKNAVNDGLYLVIKPGTDTTQFDSMAKGQVVITFNKMFIDNTGQDFTRILIDTSEYVPLELEKAPTTEPQTDIKKKLMLSLTPQASEILKVFSSKHINEHVVIVVDGEALTMHKIRVAITSGQLQITRCSDNACEKLFIMLKDNVKK
jgi:hypothetical protein